MNNIETMKLALEALETNNKAWKSLADSGDAGWWEAEKQPFYDISVKAITALRQAIEQAQQANTRPYYTVDELNAWTDEKEKQAWRNAAIRIGEELSSVGPDGYYEMDAWKWLDWAMEQEPRGKNSLAQQAEPDYYGLTRDHLWMSITKDHHDRLKPEFRMACYTSPPHRQPLTNEEINSIAQNNHPLDGIRTFARAIEAAHGIKENT